jgi:hypothetical protein
MGADSNTKIASAREHCGAERVLEVVRRILQVQWLELETHRPIGRFQHLELVGRERIGEDGDPVNGRQHLLEQPEPFGQQLEVLKE